MADAKPFSDEELKVWNNAMWKVGYPTENERRFLATIAARDTTIQQQAATIEDLKKERDDTEGLIHVNEKLNLRILNLEGWLENIHDIAVGYDGYGNDVKKLKGLIDELREIACQADTKEEK